LRLFKPILERVAELQAEANKRIEDKLDLSRETIGKRLRIASRMAERQENPAALAQCELGMARVFHSNITQDDTTNIDFTKARSMQDIGRKLLQSVGFAAPDDDSIKAAIEANNIFVDALQTIHSRAARTLDAAPMLTESASN